MNIISSNESINNISANTIVIPISQNNEINNYLTQILPQSILDEITNLKQINNFVSKVANTFTSPNNALKKIENILYISTGKNTELSFIDLQKISSVIISNLKNIESKSALLLTEGLLIDNTSQNKTNRQLAEHLLSTSYSFNNFKSNKTDTLDSLEKITLHSKNLYTNEIKTALAIANGMNFTKDLANTPPNICNPSFLANEAIKLSGQYSKLSVEILEESDLEKLNMQSFLAVTKGSKQPAKMLVLKYNGLDNTEEAPHVLVGKGVTFDSGGISLKPGAGMDEMKYDMCGAASVFGTFKTILDLNINLNVIGIIPCTENMPSGEATRPGDIVTTMSGQTVEILNTDAEGRLILCDALTYAERFNPKSVVDIATLTGACLIALGTKTSGLMSNSSQLAEKLLTAGKESFDKAWELPLFEEYQEQLASPFADIANIGGRNAGTITAGCYLSRFTKNYTWAHLDIAGTAWNSNPSTKGATGRPVPLLTQYLLNEANKN